MANEKSISLPPFSRMETETQFDKIDTTEEIGMRMYNTLYTITIPRIPYTFRKIIGEGRDGTVYAATDAKNNKIPRYYM